MTPGYIVTCRQTGVILYTVVGKADDGQRWRLRSMRIDHRGRAPQGALLAKAMSS